MVGLISIIVSVYNIEKYLYRCFDLVVVQIYRKLANTLKNKNSVNGSDKICNKYANKDKLNKMINKIKDRANSVRNVTLDIVKVVYMLYDKYNVHRGHTMYNFIREIEYSVLSAKLVICYCNIIFVSKYFYASSSQIQREVLV